MSITTTRLFEYQDEKSAKFWEVTTQGVTVTVRYGKIGTTGQSQTKELADAAAAAKHVAKLVAEKTGKGYVEKYLDGFTSTVSHSASVTTGANKKPEKLKVDEETDEAKNLKITHEGFLVGDFTKNLVIGRLNGSAPTYFYESDDFDLAEKSGKLLAPNLLISDNDLVEKLTIFSDEIFCEYIVIENFANLREVFIKKKRNSSNSEIFWIIFKDLPLLRKISICSGVRWLQVKNLPQIFEINLEGCENLSHLEILDSKNLGILNLHNCRMLPKVQGLTEGDAARLKVKEQLMTSSGLSNGGLSLKNLKTISDVDKAFDIINRGIKNAVIKGVFKEDEYSGFCYGRQDDPKFVCYSYRQLRPLEYVYTGGTGETYTFEYIVHDYGDWGYGILDGVGYNSPLDCVKRALDDTIEILEEMEFKLPGRKKLTADSLFEELKKMALNG